MGDTGAFAGNKPEDDEGIDDVDEAAPFIAVIPADVDDDAPSRLCKCIAEMASMSGGGDQMGALRPE